MPFGLFSDDCASNPCLYGGTCTDLVNGYQCTCPVGYLGQRCENRVNPCSLNRCSNGDCVDAYPMDLFRCICSPGYQYGMLELQCSIQQKGLFVLKFINLHYCVYREIIFAPYAPIVSGQILNWAKFSL